MVISPFLAGFQFRNEQNLKKMGQLAGCASFLRTKFGITLVISPFLAGLQFRNEQNPEQNGKVVGKSSERLPGPNCDLAIEDAKRVPPIDSDPTRQAGSLRKCCQNAFPLGWQPTPSQMGTV